MHEISWIFDGVLALTLIGLTWRLLSITDLFKAIMLFIAFGLLMALTWVRLEAVDIALAEAAIGAGLTGALLLTTLRHLDSQDCSDAKPGQGETTENHDDRS